MTKLQFEQIKAITRGVSSVEEQSDGVHFFRFTKEQEEYYRSERTERLFSRTVFPSTVSLAFRTDSTKMHFKASVEIFLTERNRITFDILVNGALCDMLTNVPEELTPYEPTAALPDGVFEKTVELGAGWKEVEIWLPFCGRVALKELSLDDGASFEPLIPARKLFCYGDSITQGFDARHPVNTYVVQLAKAFDAELFNKGIGGDVFYPRIAECREYTEPDIITVAYGTNDFTGKAPEDFRDRCHRFFETLGKNYPNAKIFGISPLWRASYLTNSKTQFKSFFEVEEEIRAAVSALPNGVFIRGFELIPHDTGLFADHALHPTDDGFLYYGKNLIEAMRPFLISK